MAKKSKFRCRQLAAWLLGAGWTTSVLVLLALQTAALGVSAAWHSPVIDEPAHLLGGLRFWETGHFDLDRGNPPLVGVWASIPACFAAPQTDWKQFPSSFLCAQDFMRQNGRRGLDYIVWGRWMLLPIGAVGGWVCAQWARQLYGRHAGLMAVLMWCACPLLLANTELITGDIASTVAALSTMYAGWLWMRQPTWKRATILGVILGIAELTKFVCAVLYPLLFCCWFLGRVCRFHDKRPGSSVIKDFQQGIAATLISLVIINAGYCFDGTMQPLAKHGMAKYLSNDFSLELNAGNAQPGGHEIKQPWWGRIPVPLPLNYLGGANEISQLFEQLHPTYFRGKWIRGGVWYYYLAGLLWKLPFASLVLFAFTVVFSWTDERLSRKWPQELILAVAAGAFLLFVTCVTTVQYLRYAIPILPYLIIYTSKSAHWILKGPRPIGIGIAGLVTWAMVATICIFPHQGSYFNELAGGPEHGAEYLIESSIDWGQDLFFLKAWLDDHPDAQPFYLAFMGKCDPRDVGIAFEMPPALSRGQRRGSFVPDLQPGYYAISKSLLAGFEWPALPDGKGQYLYVNWNSFDYLKSCPVIGRAGHSILVFQVTPEKALELRNPDKLR